MPIRSEKHITSNYMRVELFPVRKAPRARRNRYRPTSEVQARLNQRNREKHFSDLINANFTPDDWILHPTYSDEFLPETLEECLKNMRNFIRRIKRLIKARGGDPKAVKYIYTTQKGEKRGRFHHHMTLSAPGISYEDLSAIWGMGHCAPAHLEFNEHGLIGWAHYCLRDGSSVRSFNTSKNLDRPAVRKSDGDVLVRDVRHIASNPNDHEYIKQLIGDEWEVADVRLSTESGEVDTGTGEVFGGLTPYVLSGLFVSIELYRRENEYFRRDRYGRYDYTYRPRGGKK